MNDESEVIDMVAVWQGLEAAGIPRGTPVEEVQLGAVVHAESWRRQARTEMLVYTDETALAGAAKSFEQAKETLYLTAAALAATCREKGIGPEFYSREKLEQWALSHFDANEQAFWKDWNYEHDMQQSWLGVAGGHNPA